VTIFFWKQTVALFSCYLCKAILKSMKSQKNIP